MSIYVYILIFLGVIALGWVIVFIFDYLLYKGVLQLIVRKSKQNLDTNKLKEIFQKIMESHRQKWAFQTYLGAVTTIISIGGWIPFLRADLFVVNENGIIDLKLLADNSIPYPVLIAAMVLVTLGYFTYLYFSNKKYRSDILKSAARLINEQFLFVPTQDWFKTKSELHIKNLGKKIDLSINFKYELFEDAFASTCRDERLTRRFSGERSILLKDFARCRDHYEKKLDTIELQAITEAINQIIDNLSLKHLDEKGLRIIEQSIEKAENGFKTAIENKKIRYDDYDYTNVHSALGKIRAHIDNPWIQSIKGQSLLVYGKGGYGKTHLLAKIVQKRLEEKLPTIFFIGQVITDTSIPMEQVLETLDLKCKKETFYQALDDYGEKHGRVLLVIDGINEGIGLSHWKNHLLPLFNEIEPYRNIGLIVSVRTNGGNSWINRFIREEGFPSYQHRGFEQNVSGAVEYMFKSFSVPLPAWPILSSEFRNPMLLTIFCRSHQGDKNSPPHETRLEIIEHYIKHFNERLSSFFHYSSSITVLQDVLHDIAATMIDKGSRWKLSQSDLMEILGRNQTIGNDAHKYLNALVDEGLLNEYYFSEDKHYYSFGYDTMSGFLIATTMVEKQDISGDLLYDEVVVEALTDVVPAKTGKEIFEVISEENCGFSLLEMFVEGLPMRNDLTETGARILKDYLEKRQLPQVFDIISRVPYHQDWPLNANVLDELLKQMQLVQRDAEWTTIVSGYTVIKDNISVLVSWAWSASNDVVAHLDKEKLLLICRQLIWTLSTTDLSLRDRSTRALVNLLRNECDCLLRCLEDYCDINDDYIVERLFAVAFGCCTSNQSDKYVRKVALSTYDHLFKGGNPRENILVRDFGRSIIDYALSLGCKLNIEKEKVIGPYCKEKKNVEVPTEEIKKYELDFDITSDKELYYAQSNIMYSMRTEYSSRGLYGDFGRYTFQALLDNWDEDIEQVSNYAIKYIFEELGYDANVFKKFDGQHSSQFRNKNSIERIGKKYQWIALHKVAAILADNHYGEPNEKRSWRGPMNINVRKFDPTLFMNPDMLDYIDTLPKYEVPEYDLSHDDDEKWMRNWRKMPNVKEYIEYELGGNTWINLYSYYTVSSINQLDMSLMAGKNEREIWSFVQAFMVDGRDRRHLCRLIHKEGLGGRSSSENSEVYSIYYREYYWSDYYKSEVEGAGLTNRVFELDRKITNIQVQPAYLLYSISEYSDASLTESQEVIMPSPYLYKGIGMGFSINDGVWLVGNGVVACYDSHWVHGGQGCLLIRKDLFLDYLKKNKKCVVWPILMERSYKPNPSYWQRIQVGGYVWMDEKGCLHSKFRSYEEKWRDKLKKKVSAWMNAPVKRTKLFLYNHGLLKINSMEAKWIMTEIDYKKLKHHLKDKPSDKE